VSDAGMSMLHRNIAILHLAQKL